MLKAPKNFCFTKISETLLTRNGGGVGRKIEMGQSAQGGRLNKISNEEEFK